MGPKNCRNSLEFRENGLLVVLLFAEKSSFPPLTPPFPNHVIIFSHALHLRFIPTIWEPGVVAITPWPVLLHEYYSSCFFRISPKNVWNVLHWSSMHWLPHISFSQIPFVHLVCQDDWLISKALAKLPDSSAIIFSFRKLERITKRRIVSLKIPCSAVFWSQTRCYNFAKPPGEKVGKWREKILTK